jgi:hypothetical protein
MMLSPSSDRQVRAGRSAIDLLDDENHQVATIYATRAGLHIQCGPRYELDGNGLAVEVQQPTGLQIAFTRR